MRCTNFGYYLPEVGVPPASGLGGFDLFYSKSAINWPAFNPNSNGEQLLAGLSGSITAAGNFPRLSSTTTGALVDSLVNYQAPVFTTSVATPLYTCASVPCILKPPSDSTSAFQVVSVSSGAQPTIFDTSNGRLGVGQSTASTATLCAGGNAFCVNGSGFVVANGGVTTVGVPGLVYNMSSGNLTGSLGSTSMTTSPSGNHNYKFEVSGVTMMRDCFQAVQNRQARIQKTLSTARSLGLGCLRFITANCCRSARFSRSRLCWERKQRASRPNHNRKKWNMGNSHSKWANGGNCANC
jgi:hypothetical protein